jgi:hypothetical protein
MSAILSFYPGAFSLDDQVLSGLANEELVLIENVTNEITRAELQLMKISTQFHVSWLRQGNWKSWRLFMYKLAGSTLTNAGMITIAASRFQYSRDPAAAPRDYLKAGHIVNLTAASVVVGGTLIESTLDRLVERRLGGQRADCGSTLEKFLQVRAKLDSLLVKRNNLIQSCTSLTPGQSEILNIEGQILNDLKQLASIEFANSYCDVVRIRTSRNLANVTALLSASTAGYMGSLNSLLSVANHYPKQTGVAGLGFITSGSTVVASPLITQLGTKLAVSKAAKQLRDHQIELNNPAAQLDSHCLSLQRLIATANPADVQLLNALQVRRAIYARHHEILDSRQEVRAGIKDWSRRELTERLIFSSIVGGTNIARGAQLSVAGFHYYDSPKDSFKLVASASTAYIVGSGVWTADNIQGKLREELLKKKLSAAKLSMHAKLLTDLRDLELMEDQMSVY